MKSTFLDRVRLGLAVVLFLFSLLILFPAPAYILWELEILAGEWGHWWALLALIIGVRAWPSTRSGRIASALAGLAFTIFLQPTLRALSISRSLPIRIERSIGRAEPRNFSDAHALEKPFSLRTLFVKPRSPTVVVSTIAYATRPSGALPLDLYTRPFAASRRPVVVSLHGGSWHGGNRSDLPALDFYLAARGYAVADVTYRLAPEFPNPAATQDLNSAIDFLKAHADSLGLDPTRIALLGRSAGAHLVLLSAYTKNDPAIRGVVAFYAPSDQVFGYENPSRIIDSRQILQDYVTGTPASNSQGYRDNSPSAHVTPATVPTLLIHGTKDELVFAKQSRMLDARLAAAGRRHLLLELPWATHGCDYIFNGPCGQLSTFAIERFLATVMQ